MIKGYLRDDHEIIYPPILSQGAKIATSLIIFLIFGTVQWFRLDEPGQLDRKSVV